MHFKSYKKYKKSSMRFTLPIIIISTITGTANFAQNTFPVAWQPLVPSAIGAFNLIAAIMTTILQFLKINELMESHRVSAIQYGKLGRSIRLQLTLPPGERLQDGAAFIESCYQEYDRLIEQSPAVPGNIIRSFEKEFPIRKQKKKRNVNEQRTFCLDFRNYCCTSFKEEIDEKDVNLERPEIIKLTPIKPFGFHDGTTRSDFSQTTSIGTETNDHMKSRFKPRHPLLATPSLTPMECDTPTTNSESPLTYPRISELMLKFEEKIETLPEPDPSPPATQNTTTPVAEEEIISSDEVVLNVDELRQKFNQLNS
jgi:hypothetical protein